MNQNETAIAVKQDVDTVMPTLGINGTTYVSFEAETMKDKIALYNALNNPAFKIGDMINKPIYIRDAVITGVEINDRNTGELRDAARCTIIDKDGKAYSATSSGILNSLKNILKVFGTLHFDEPLKVVVNQVQTKNGNTLNLSISE